VFLCMRMPTISFSYFELAFVSWTFYNNGREVSSQTSCVNISSIPLVVVRPYILVLSSLVRETSQYVTQSFNGRIVLYPNPVPSVAMARVIVTWKKIYVVLDCNSAVHPRCDAFVIAIKFVISAHMGTWTTAFLGASHESQWSRPSWYFHAHRREGKKEKKHDHLYIPGFSILLTSPNVIA